MSAEIQKLYIAYFNRPADPGGLAYWTDQLAKGVTMTTIANSFSASAEYQAIYAGKSNLVLIDQLYQNLFGRTADVGGLLFWSNEMLAGRVTITTVASALSSGTTPGSADNIAINSKISAATAFTAAIDTAPELLAYSGSAATAQASAWLSTVTTAATLATAITPATLNAAVASSVAASTVSAGSTFTLTTSADNFTPTAKDDIFNASLVFDVNEAVTTASQMSIADILAGGAGTDTLNIVISGAQDGAVTVPVASTSSIETVNIRNTVAQDATYAATNGLTTAASDRSAGAVVFSGLAAGAVGGVIGDGVVTNGASTFGYGSTVTSGTVNFSGGTLGTPVVTTSGTLLATQTVNSTGAANVTGALTMGAAVTTLNINATTNLTTGALTNTTAAALTRINVTGAGTVNLSSTALQATVATIDASAATGALTVALGSLVTQTVTGGSGNDVITTGAVLTTGSVNAGAGTGDVLDVGTNVAHVNTTSLAAKYTNFETVRIGAAALDMSLIGGITGVQLTGAATLTNMTATQAAAVTARDNIGNASLALATATGTSDVLTITNGLGTTTAAATTVGTLVATGFETINLVANPGPSATSGANRTTTVTAITDTSLNNVNLTGTAFTFADIASTKAVAWNASALTGNGASTPVGLTLTTTGAAFAGSVVTGSALRDSVIMNSSTGVTFNLGAGNDLFSTTSTLLLPSGASTDNTINAGDGATDRLVITAAATLTDTHFTKTTGFEQLELAGGALVESVTGLGAGFLSAFAGGVSVTDTAVQTGANTFTWSSGLYAQPVTIVHETTYVGTAAGGNQTITTGAGNDNITVIASSWVGVAGNNGATIAVSTGAGNDTITVTTATQLAQTVTAPVVITGGLGADTIVSTGVNITTGAGVLTTTYVIAAGDSTTTAYDSITGFDLGTAGLLPSTLDLVGTGAVTTYAATAPTGYTAAQLTVAVTATSGLVVFAGTSASALTLAEKIAAVQSVVTTTTTDLAVFTHGSNSYVFQNNTAGDIVVELVGVAATNIIVANANLAGSVLVL